MPRFLELRFQLSSVGKTKVFKDEFLLERSLKTLSRLYEGEHGVKFQIITCGMFCSMNTKCFNLSNCLATI